MKKENRLKYQSSPYLQQHKDNKIHWYPWCDEAFEDAKKEDKPIFLSIGYSTCHWCHVMAHESFDDEEVANILNENFISVKVDREERPDIDSVYMSVCNALTGSGGWPLTIIMNAEAKPFFAGTYLPKHNNFGQIGLIELLNRVMFLWKNKRDELSAAGEEITKVLNTAEKEETVDFSEEIYKRGYKELKRSFDKEYAGFGRAPKFPMPHNLLFLMRYSEIYDDSEALLMAEKTLKYMAAGGIFDQIGGGFSRYSTDNKWLIPHFEKMLYDNALLLWAYSEAYSITKEERYADVITRSTEYLMRELKGEEGGYYCGQDADIDGQEGKFYVLTPEEIIKLLGEKDGKEFCKIYLGGNGFEGGFVPNLMESDNEPWSNNDERLKKVYEYRKERFRLHTDVKVLLSWNSLAAIGFLKAGQALNKEEYIKEAENIYNFIENYLKDENGRLYSRYCKGERAFKATLDDYAFYSYFLILMYKHSFNAEYLKKAVFYCREMIKYFEDSENGGYFITSYDSESLIIRPKEYYDGAMPSGNSFALAVLCELSSFTGEMDLKNAAERQLKFMSSKMKEYPAGNTFSLMAAMEYILPHKMLVCCGHALPKELKDIKKHGIYILYKSNENAEILSECVPFTASYPVPMEGELYYLCRGNTCLKPVKSISELKI